jgi:hypothetical protein
MSILGPLLFIIFINDLPLENLTSEIDMYADEDPKIQFLLNFRHPYILTTDQ